MGWSTIWFSLGHFTLNFVSLQRDLRLDNILIYFNGPFPIRERERAKRPKGYGALYLSLAWKHKRWRVLYLLMLAWRRPLPFKLSSTSARRRSRLPEMQLLLKLLQSSPLSWVLSLFLTLTTFFFFSVLFGWFSLGLSIYLYFSCNLIEICIWVLWIFWN